MPSSPRYSPQDVERRQVDLAGVRIAAGDQAAADVAVGSATRPRRPAPSGRPSRPPRAAPMPSTSISIRKRRGVDLVAPPASGRGATATHARSATPRPRRPRSTRRSTAHQSQRLADEVRYSARDQRPIDQPALRRGGEEPRRDRLAGLTGLGIDDGPSGKVSASRRWSADRSPATIVCSSPSSLPLIMRSRSSIR